MTRAERRRGYDPAAICRYCGAPREQHDRVAQEWERCQEKAAKLVILLDRSVR